MEYTARIPIGQINAGRFMLLQRALLRIQKEANEKLDINKLEIKQNDLFLDFIYKNTDNEK